MRHISIPSRAIALLAACAVVLGGTAVWRHAAAPRLTLQDRAGDRAALTGFAVDLSFGYASGFCSVVTIQNGRVSSQNDFQPEEQPWYRSPLDGKEFAISVLGEAKKRPYSAASDIKLVPAGDAYTIQAALEMWSYTDDGRSRSLLLGDLHPGGGGSSSSFLSAAAPSTLRVHAEDAPRAAASQGWSTAETSQDATCSVIRFSHENADAPFTTLLEANARLHEKRYMLIGPYDDRFGQEYTGSAALYRIDAATDNPETHPAAATVLTEFPVEGRAFLGLAVYSDDLLLLITREGDEIVLTLLGGDGQAVTDARLPYPGIETEFMLTAAPPDSDGEIHAFLTLRAADASDPSGGSGFNPTPNTYFRLSYAHGALTAAGPWSEADFGGLPFFEPAMLGTRLLAVRMQYTHPNEGISYHRMDYDEDAMNIRAEQEAVIAVYDLSADKPAPLYQGAIALPTQPIQNPLVYPDDTPSIRKLEGRAA